MTKIHKTGSTLDRKLVIVDVGCRWGFADSFIDNSNEVTIYGFDPDKEECQRLQQMYAGKTGVVLVPLALSDREGSKKLYITREPACSSMYEPDEYLTSRYPALDCARKVGEQMVEVTTLDIWATQNNVEFIDHMKIDTQGSELDILKGGQAILRTIRTLEVEVEFNPIYKGQPLFSDVDLFLREQGFVLWKLTNLVHYGSKDENQIRLGDDHIHNDDVSQNIDLLGGQIYWADAHYVRSEIVRADYGNDHHHLQRDITLLRKLNHQDLADRLRQSEQTL